MISSELRSVVRLFHLTYQFLCLNAQSVALSALLNPSSLPSNTASIFSNASASADFSLSVI